MLWHFKTIVSRQEDFSFDVRTLYTFRGDVCKVAVLISLQCMIHVQHLKWQSPPLIDFVCVEVLRPSQPNGVMSSMVSLPNHTFTGQA